MLKKNQNFSLKMKKKINVIPKILFITGLPSSGKTTIALSLKYRMKKLGIKNIKYIDGDIFRKKFKLNKYDNKSRNKTGDKKIKYANSFLKSGYLTIVTGVAHDSIWRKKIKKCNKDIIEIYSKCPLKICKSRDFKKNYVKAQNNDINNFVGINKMYIEGKSVDITLNTYKNNVTKNTNKIIQYLKKNKYVYGK